MEDNLTFLYCFVDDFCQQFYPLWRKHLLACGQKKRNRESLMRPSEIMTIVIHFHQSHYRNFKAFYQLHVKPHLLLEFPNLLSYSRFIQLLPSVLFPLYFFLSLLKGEKTGIYFIDATVLKVCHIKREKKHRVFKGLAQKSRSTMGWFFGFKLHLVVNDRGELIQFCVTSGNVDDRKPVFNLVETLIGKLVGDKGYLSKDLADLLQKKGLKLITSLKKNMKPAFMAIEDKILLRKRSIIETINDQLKNISQIEHSRHRSVWNFMGNILSALIAYALKPKKPSLNIPEFQNNNNINTLLIA